MGLSTEKKPLGDDAHRTIRRVLEFNEILKGVLLGLYKTMIESLSVNQREKGRGVW